MNEFPDYKYRPKKKPKKQLVNSNENGTITSAENIAKNANNKVILNKTQKKLVLLKISNMVNKWPVVIFFSLLSSRWSNFNNFSIFILKKLFL